VSDRERTPIKAKVPGQKRQKVGGGQTRSLSPRPRKADVLGAFELPKNYVVGYEPRVRQYPFSKPMEKLLGTYFRYRSFWEVCAETKTVEWAGKQMLGVAKSRACEIFAEIRDSRDNWQGGGPLGWFRSRYMEGVHDGSFHRGRETLSSHGASLFFGALSQGVSFSDILKEHRTRQMVEQIPRIYHGWQMHCVEYYVYSNLKQEEE
jgi:hypothetical protein